MAINLLMLSFSFHPKLNPNPSLIECREGLGSETTDPRVTMPTPLDRALNSKNLLLGFAGMVTAAAAWSIWGSDVLPTQSDPTGGEQIFASIIPVAGQADNRGQDPDNWTADEMKRWLRVRGLLPSENATREQLLERVKANLRPPSRRTPASQEN